MLIIAKNPHNPSKVGLLDAFGRAFDDNRTALSFHMEDGSTSEVQVTALRYESGVPFLFVFSGNFAGTNVGSFDGFYNTNTREGYLKPK